MMVFGRPSALFALALLAAPLLAAPLELKVVGDRVNLRARPVADAEVAGQVSTGETLLAPDGIPEGAEWVRVRPPRSVDLWIYAALVRDGVVTADDTYVRCGPGQHFKPVGKVNKGFVVEARGPAGGDWLRIAPVPSAELFISSAYVLAVPAKIEAPAAPAEPAPAPAKASTAVAPAPPQKIEAPKKAAAPMAAAAAAPAPAETSTAASTPPPKVEAPKAEAPMTAPAAVEASQTAPSPAAAVATSKADAPKATPPAAEPPPPPPPPALAAFTLAPGPRQGAPVTIRGRLERLSLARAPGFTRYQLVDKAGYSKSAAICRLIGLTGQWFELAGSEIEVEGRLWTLYGDAVPVLDAIRARRVASWEK